MAPLNEEETLKDYDPSRKIAPKFTSARLRADDVSYCPWQCGHGSPRLFERAGDVLHEPLHQILERRRPAIVQLARLSLQKTLWHPVDPGRAASLLKVDGAQPELGQLVRELHQQPALVRRHKRQDRATECLAHDLAVRRVILWR